MPISSKSTSGQLKSAIKCRIPSASLRQKQQSQSPPLSIGKHLTTCRYRSACPNLDYFRVDDKPPRIVASSPTSTQAGRLDVLRVLQHVLSCQDSPCPVTQRERILDLQYPRLGFSCALLQPCSHSRGTIPDYTSTTSHSVVLDYGQFFGRTFWRGRKLTLNLTKRRAHTPSIKTAVMDLLTEQARSACRDADRSTHPPH
jgi:hypothetical protein